jgi:hypothetical protein
MQPRKPLSLRLAECDAPLPWTVDDMLTGIIAITDANRHRVLVVPGMRDKDHETRSTRASEVVSCMNLHEQAIDALKEARTCLVVEKSCGCKCPKCLRMEQVIGQIDGVLREAGVIE